MRTLCLRVLPCLAALLSTAGCLTASGVDSGVRLTLPPTIYSVPGVEMSLYFSNGILVRAGERLSFSVNCAVGQSDAVRWTLNATAMQVSEHPLTLKVSEKSGHVVEQGTVKVRVVPADAGRGKDIALLIVGDSLTAASLYPME